jgi:6,7-dimethyl-8-ribityllumazine synthase
MIKAVTITVVAKSKEDFRLITELLESLGLYKGTLAETRELSFGDFYPQTRSLAIFYPKREGRDVDLFLLVQDPDTAFELVQKRNLEVVTDSSGPEPDPAMRNFVVKLPGGTRIGIGGERVAHNATDLDYVALEGNLSGRGKRFAIVVSRFNAFITERLLAGAIDGLVKCGVVVYGEPFFKDIELVRVPGSFEIPSAARTLAETKKYDAIICLGCLLRGDTAHYDVIVNEVTRGIGQSAQETRVPHAFGVLTCDTLEQAIDRAGLKMGNKGFEAALAAVEMANLKSAISRQPLRLTAQGRLRTAPSKKQIPRSTRNDKNDRARSDKNEKARSHKRDRTRNSSKEPVKASKTKRRK